MIEPAYYSKPILIGPHTQNFKDIVQLFLSQQALYEVHNENELREGILKFLENRDFAVAMGKRAFDVVFHQQGLTEKAFQLIRPYLH